jgi:hypothetical protein
MPDTEVIHEQSGEMTYNLSMTQQFEKQFTRGETQLSVNRPDLKQ